MNEHIFRAYDIRGKVDPDLPIALVRDLGRAIGSLVQRRGQVPVVAVGRDARLSGPDLRDALVGGLMEVGCSVVDVGIVPTPLLYFAVHTLDVGGGVAITGSHNPGDENGFKLMIGTATAHGPDIQLLKTMVQSGDYEGAAEQAPTVRQHDIRGPYCAHILDDVHLGPHRPQIVVDAGNGPTGPIAPALLRQLGCTVHELFCDMDGTFPNHHPDPTVAENLVDLQAEIARTGADLGVAYDGDGDRIGVVDAEGQIIWGDRLLVLLSRALLLEQPGATIVGEVKCSQTLFDDITRHGGRAIMGKVGHSLIKERMRSEGALLAGEMSGHIFYQHRWFGFDDAIYTTCRLLEILSLRGRTIDQLLADLPPTHATPELRVACPDAIKFDVVERVTAHFRAQHEVIDIDGARVAFAGGWGLVRASNTGPILVLRCEADSAQTCEHIRLELEAAIAQAKLELRS